MKTVFRLVFAALVGLFSTELRAGHLTVTLAPSQAANAGAQWRVDGGSWRNSGATVRNLSNTTHQVDFRGVSGWLTPAPMAVAITNGNTTTLTATYVRPASLSITLTPHSGQWRIDGGAWQPSGAVVTNLTPGAHTIAYSSLTNHASPAAETVTLPAGQLTSLQRSYTQLAQILIGLVPDSGQWRANGGPWHPSGTSLHVPPGNYLIEYSPLALYDPPASETLTFAAGGGGAATRHYTSQKPSLRIDLGPDTGQWRIDGGAWQASGARVGELTAGTHTIDYTDVGGLHAPLASETISLALREQATLARTYPWKPGSVTVTTTPSSAQWRVFSGSSSPTGAWQPSGATVSGLPVGSYVVEYASLANHVPPAAESFVLTAAQTRIFTGSYTPHPAQFRANLEPSFAKWRITPLGAAPGDIWNHSGSYVGGLTPGTYTVDYSTVPSSDAPPAETVVLAAGQSLTVQRSYTPQLGAVSVALEPAEGRWRVDGGEWQLSGAVVDHLALGSHTIDYLSLPGYAKPPVELVTVQSGATATLARAYVQHAQLAVTLSPAAGQWRVDGGAWQPSGASVGDLAAGDHQVEFSNLPGYVTPQPLAVTLVPGEMKALNVSYAALGSVAVNLNPTTAQWRINEGPWQNSGAVVSGLAAGEYRVDFSDVFGYRVPGPELIVLAAGENRVLNKFYNVGAATLQVTLDPATARWRVYGGNWSESGASVLVGSGPHRLEFEPAPGFAAPPVENLTLGLDENRILTRAYTPLAGGYAVIKRFSDAGEFPTIIRGRDGVFYIATSANGSNGAGQIVRLDGDGTGHALLKAFPSMPNDGLGPNSLVEGSDNVLYGTTGNGGSATNRGTIFKMNKDGSGYAILRVFDSLWLGSTPNTLLEGSDGALYGTTSLGGASNSYGVVFKMNKDGSGYTVLRALNGGSDGSIPRGLTEGRDGALYGTTNSGGLNGGGTVFKVAKNGSAFTVLKALGGADGSAPRAGLLPASDGFLYGTTSTGGSANRGVVFRVGLDGSGFAVVRHFVGGVNDGGRPDCVLTEAPNGLLFGTTFGGGSGNRGTLFSMNKDGSGFTILKNFTAGATDGGNPTHRLVFAPDGTLFGATTTGGGDTWGSMFRMNPDGSGFALVRNFGAPDGSLPLAPVIQASNGALYGTTYIGGGSSLGTVFKLNADGTGHTVIHRFAATNDGARPQGALLEASDGSIYGTTSGGNPSSGMVFRFNLDGSGYTTVRAFRSDETSFLNGLIEGSDGALYGTGGAGGTTGFGNVFRLLKDGSGLTVLHAFAGGLADGKTPYAAVVEGPDGRLYGTTLNGGSSDLGTVFAVRKDGTGYVVLRHFTGGTADGATPHAALTVTSDGQLYGTTPTGGSANAGTLFRLNLDGSGYAVVKHFTGGPADGANPYYGGLVEMNGVLYGTTASGGAFNGGTLYAIARDGTGYTVVLNFGLDASDGKGPAFGLTPGSQGTLHGTTLYGGGGGTVFHLRTQ